MSSMQEVFEVLETPKSGLGKALVGLLCYVVANPLFGWLPRAAAGYAKGVGSETSEISHGRDRQTLKIRVSVASGASGLH